jgi:hypothetical protein
MRAGVSAMIVAASLLVGGTAWSACPPGQSQSPSRNCVDLGSVPQISRQIVDGEHTTAPPKTTPPDDAQPGYTGPALGLSKMIRRAPTVGYHWALD